MNIAPLMPILMILFLLTTHCEEEKVPAPVIINVVTVDTNGLTPVPTKPSDDSNTTSTMPEAEEVPVKIPVSDDFQIPAPQSDANAASPTSSTNPDPLPSELTQEIIVKRNITYQTVNGWDEKLAQLDVHYQDADASKPVAILIHGGGWTTGGRKNYEINPRLINFFIANGHIVVNVDFRLATPQATPPVTYRDMAHDIAHALKWVTQNIATYGGKSDDLTLIGYSSGAHLVSLIGTDYSYLNEAAVAPEVIRAISAWDVPAYDIPSAIAAMKGSTLEGQIPFNESLFGQTTAEQNTASPITYVSSATTIPFLLISAGIKNEKPQTISNQMSARLKDKFIIEGGWCKHFHFLARSHTSLPEEFGTKSSAVHVILKAFLDRIRRPKPVGAPAAMIAEITTTMNKIVDPDAAKSGDGNSLPSAFVGLVSDKGNASLSFGSRTLAADSPPTADTFYALGSISKLFTGLILARKVVHQKIDPNSAVKETLKSPLKELFNPTITFNHLVTHFSGLPNFPENLTDFRDFDSDGVDDRSPSSPAGHYLREHIEACLKAGKCKPVTQPGKTYTYSNLGIGLLGIALQDHRGSLYFDDINRSLLAWPLLMDDTGTDREYFIQKTTRRSATGYSYDAQTSSLQVRTFPNMGDLAGSGGLISTGRNMMTLLEMLIGIATPAWPGNGVEKWREAVTLATTPTKTIHDSTQMGYAIDIIEGSNGQPIYLKTGLTSGTTAVIIWRNSPRLGLIFLSNRGKFAQLNKIPINLINTLTQVMNE